MLTQVLSRVRRRIRPPQRHQDPPDLRRWSDFMNPFPPISPGGYKRYYETHGIPEPTPVATILLPSSPKPLTPRRRHNASLPPSPASSSSHAPLPFPPSSPSNRRKNKRSKALGTIPEGSPSLTSIRSPTLSNTSSLRRRHRQLLRTPSVERDFHGKTPTITISTTELDGFSSNSSSQSHSSQLDSPDSDTPPTSVEGFDDLPSLFKEGMKLDVDAYRRPDSISSYYTARSRFSDD